MLQCAPLFLSFMQISSLSFCSCMPSSPSSYITKPTIKALWLNSLGGNPWDIHQQGFLISWKEYGKIFPQTHLHSALVLLSKDQGCRYPAKQSWCRCATTESGSCGLAEMWQVSDMVLPLPSKPTFWTANWQTRQVGWTPGLPGSLPWLLIMHVLNYCLNQRCQWFRPKGFAER